MLCMLVNLRDIDEVSSKEGEWSNERWSQEESEGQVLSHGSYDVSYKRYNDMSYNLFVTRI